jgi:hypothetical protein
MLKDFFSFMRALRAQKQPDHFWSKHRRLDQNYKGLEFAHAKRHAAFLDRRQTPEHKMIESMTNWQRHQWMKNGGQRSLMKLHYFCHLNLIQGSFLSSRLGPAWLGEARQGKARQG